jgi:hypothetical protein
MSEAMKLINSLVEYHRHFYHRKESNANSRLSGFAVNIVESIVIETRDEKDDSFCWQTLSPAASC